jgi:malonyl-CoA O-methyltransferase
MDAARALSECQRVLKPKGKLYFTTFGPQTLRELREVFPGSIIDFCPLPKLETLLIHNRFCEVKSEQVLVSEMYPDVKTLMYSLKNIGAQNGKNAKKGLTGAKAFMRQMEYYRQKFDRNGAVTASFEIIFGEGQR